MSPPERTPLLSSKILNSGNCEYKTLDVSSLEKKYENYDEILNSFDSWRCGRKRMLMISLALSAFTSFIISAVKYDKWLVRIALVIRGVSHVLLQRIT
uniref:Transmembrane protein n=1 Tax=Heterorhabditis bacteriophora TaxID=37862 RepID=A0A1I7WQ21_HETBA